MSPFRHAAVVIPVWNGSDVIHGCLEALYAHSGKRLHAVIAVDNASPDDSVSRIEQAFPQVQLLRQSYNLGFAGGVNAGMHAGEGGGTDCFVLLNQDCLVQPGWLDALAEGLDCAPEAGIAGCTIYDAEGALNHTGAVIERPVGRSRHLTDMPASPVRREYVTGAVFAITKEAWHTLGPLDEDYYPAYYEEADYCYRARGRGFGVIYVPQATVRHLKSSQAWRADPLLHDAFQHRARYRFIAKHYTPSELAAFFPAEVAAIDEELWFDQALGRALGARHMLRTLDSALTRRQQELGNTLPMAERRRLHGGFGEIAQAALRRAQAIAERNFAEPIPRRAQRRLGLLGADPPHQPSPAARRAAQLHTLMLLAEYDYR